MTGSAALGTQEISVEDYGKYTYAQSVNAEVFAKKDKTLLYAFANALAKSSGNDCVPDYAKS